MRRTCFSHHRHASEVESAGRKDGRKRKLASSLESCHTDFVLVFVAPCVSYQPRFQTDVSQDVDRVRQRRQPFCFFAFLQPPWSRLYRSPRLAQAVFEWGDPYFAGR